MTSAKRKDRNRAVLKTGESQRANGTYSYNWYDINGKRHFVYARTLQELRIKEQDVTKKTLNGINPAGRYKTLNDIYLSFSDINIPPSNNEKEYCTSRKPCPHKILGVRISYKTYKVIKGKPKNMLYDHQIQPIGCHSAAFYKRKCIPVHIQIASFVYQSK